MRKRNKNGRFSGSTCSAAFSIERSEVAIVRVRGILTRTSLTEFRHWLYQQVLPRASGAVVDLRFAVVAVDAAALASRDGRQVEFHGPISVVAPAEAERELRDWVWERVLDGLSRQVCTSEADALAWTRRWAEICVREGRELWQGLQPFLPIETREKLTAVRRGLLLEASRSRAD